MEGCVNGDLEWVSRDCGGEDADGRIICREIRLSDRGQRINREWVQILSRQFPIFRWDLKGDLLFIHREFTSNVACRTGVVCFHREPHAFKKIVCHGFFERFPARIGSRIALAPCLALMKWMPEFLMHVILMIGPIAYEIETVLPNLRVFCDQLRHPLASEPE